MQKSKALELLGGSTAAAAKAIGVSYQAVEKWPDPLPDRIADRVIAAIARKHLPPELLGEAAPSTTGEPGADQCADAGGNGGSAAIGNAEAKKAAVCATT